MGHKHRRRIERCLEQRRHAEFMNIKVILNFTCTLCMCHTSSTLPLFFLILLPMTKEEKEEKEKEEEEEEEKEEEKVEEEVYSQFEVFIPNGF